MAAVQPQRSAAEVDAALAEALKQNAKLKKRLGKLLKIDKGLDAKDDKDLRKLERQTQREVCKHAFEDFDLDKSGFIDQNELSLLATELGAPLEDKELEAALKAIDTSGDGKISFDEFFKWWSGHGAAVVGEQNIVKLALLRARLVSHKGKKVLDAMAAEHKKNTAAAAAGAADAKAAPAVPAAAAGAGAAAGKGADAKDAKAGAAAAAAEAEQKTDDAVPADARVHQYSAHFGDFDQPRARLTFGLRSAAVLDKELLVAADAKYSTFVSVDVKSVGKADFVPYLQAIAKSFSSSLAQYVTVNVTAPAKDIARITVGFAFPFPDPSALLHQLGVEPASLARAVRVSVELRHSPADAFNPKLALTGFDLMQFRVDSRLVLDSAMVNAVRNGLAAAPARGVREFVSFAPFLSAVDSSVRLSFGELGPLVDVLRADPATAALLDEKFLRIGDKIAELTARQMTKAVERDRRKGQESRTAVSVVRMLLLTLARDFAEFVGVTAWTRGGLAAEVQLHGLLNVQQILDGVTWADGVVQAAVPGAAQGGPHQQQQVQMQAQRRVYH